jgi:DNA-binding LacI/PurR family transcriptional regulator
MSAASVTSYDVARRAGVSQSAVSRVFKDGASASRPMRERVRRAARELGYTPNGIARSLITRKSNSIAVLISSLTNLYYPEVLAEISARLQRLGLHVLLFNLPHESDVDAVIDSVFSYRVDGVIAAARLQATQLDQFSARRVPVVFYNRQLRDTPANAVCCDQFEGAALLVDRLHSAGHRRFGVLAGPKDSVVGEERLRGAVARLDALGLGAPSVVRGSFDYESGYRGVIEVRGLSRRMPDALLAANDVNAIGAIDAVRNELGLRVPQDLSVVGFDGVGPSRWKGYELTTIRQPVEQMAEAAVSLLLACIEDPSRAPEKRLFAGTFIPGGSARLSPLPTRAGKP